MSFTNFKHISLSLYKKIEKNVKIQLCPSFQFNRYFQMHPNVIDNLSKIKISANNINKNK